MRDLASQGKACDVRIIEKECFQSKNNLLGNKRDNQ